MDDNVDIQFFCLPYIKQSWMKFFKQCCRQNLFQDVAEVWKGPKGCQCRAPAGVNPGRTLGDWEGPGMTSQLRFSPSAHVFPMHPGSFSALLAIFLISSRNEVDRIIHLDLLCSGFLPVQQPKRQNVAGF